MAATTNLKKTRVANVIIDKSQGKQLRIMEDSLSNILHPYIDKLSKDKNWYSPLLALISVVLSIVKFDFQGIIKLDESNVFIGFHWGLLICAILYVIVLFAALFLLIRSLVYIYKHRKDDLTVRGIMREVMSLPTEAEIESNINKT